MNRSPFLLVATGTGFALLAMYAALRLTAEQNVRQPGALPGAELQSNLGKIEGGCMSVESGDPAPQQKVVDRSGIARPDTHAIQPHDSGSPSVALRQGPSESAMLKGTPSEPSRTKTALADDHTEMPVADASGEPVWIPTNPQLPGNSLSLKGQHAEIHGFQPAPDSVGVGLSLMVSDEIENVFPASSATPVASVHSGTDRVSTTVSAGFTYEQELFRTKWGWAAYDQVQKVLREESSQ